MVKVIFDIFTDQLKPGTILTKYLRNYTLFIKQIVDTLNTIESP